MLNSKLDVEQLQANFARDGYLSISNILQEDVALALERGLQKQAWNLELRDYVSKDKLRIPQSELPNPENLMQGYYAAMNTLDPNQMMYMRLCAEVEDFAQPALSEFNQFVNSENFLKPMRTITSQPDVRGTWIEATAFGSNCFLGSHGDNHNEENLVALSFNLTRNWRPDWGGALVIDITEQQPSVVLPAVWNTLNIMAIPVNHYVTTVSPAAVVKRYSMSGWLR